MILNGPGPLNDIRSVCALNVAETHVRFVCALIAVSIVPIVSYGPAAGGPTSNVNVVPLGSPADAIEIETWPVLSGTSGVAAVVASSASEVPTVMAAPATFTCVELTSALMLLLSVLYRFCRTWKTLGEPSDELKLNACCSVTDDGMT